MTNAQRKARLQELACKEKTSEVIEEIILHCKDLMYMYVHKFNMINEHMGYAAAEDGLIKAIKSYDQNKAASFLTYASVCIYNELGMLYRRNKGHNRCVSTETLITENIRLEETLVSSVNIEDSYVSNSMVPEIRKAVIEEINELPNPAHIKVLTMWAESNFTLKQDDLAERCNLSQSYVSRILVAFKRSLRSKLKSIGVVVK